MKREEIIRQELEDRIMRIANYFIISNKSFDEICSELNINSSDMVSTFNEVGRIIAPYQFAQINAKYNIYNEDEEIKKIK